MAPSFTTRDRPPAVRSARELRFRTLGANPFYRGTPAARRELEARLSSLLHPQGELELARSLYRDGRLAAYLVLHRPEAGARGGPGQDLELEADRRLPRARAWLAEEVLRVRERFRPGLSLSLLAGNDFLLPALEQAGLSTRSLLVHGSVRTAWRRWRRRRKPLVDPGSLGLRVERMEHAWQVEAEVRMTRDWYRAHPEFGPSCAGWAWLDGERQRLLDTLGTDHDRYLFLEGREVRGFFGFTLSEGPAWGRQAHPDFLFSPPIQGKGLLGFALDRLLPRMVARGARLWMGGTSQPAVLASRRSLGGRVMATHLRLAPPAFPPGHFG